VGTRSRFILLLFAKIVYDHTAGNSCVMEIIEFNAKTGPARVISIASALVVSQLHEVFPPGDILIIR